MPEIVVTTQGSQSPIRERSDDLSTKQKKIIAFKQRQLLDKSPFSTFYSQVQTENFFHQGKRATQRPQYKEKLDVSSVLQIDDIESKYPRVKKQILKDFHE